MTYMKIAGDIHDIDISHVNHGKTFYKCYIDSPRYSGTIDTIPVIFGEALLPKIKDKNTIFGEFRSYTKNSKLYLFVFANDIMRYKKNVNSLEIKGNICKVSPVRETPNGYKICDILVANDRTFGKHDYIPCVLWNEAAENRIQVGDYVDIYGRVQSRVYSKNDEDHVAYEVSINDIIFC